jgi:hypothetical protein
MPPKFNLILPHRPMKSVNVIQSNSSESSITPLFPQTNKQLLFNNFATEIINGLWIGSYESIQNQEDLYKYNINCIINATFEKYDINLSQNLNIEFLNLENTNLKQDIDIGVHFEFITRKIHECLCNNKNVLIYCRDGINSSATFIIAYLMKYGINKNIALLLQNTEQIQMSYKSAFNFVTQKRKIGLNFNFILALYKLESNPKHIFLIN